MGIVPTFFRRSFTSARGGGGKITTRYKKKQKHRRGEPKVNEHHIFYPRTIWNEYPWSKEVRNHPYYKKIIPIVYFHDKIHCAVPEIPILDREICLKILDATDQAIKLGLLHPRYDRMEQRIDFLATVLFQFADKKRFLPTYIELMKQRHIAAIYYSRHKRG